MSPSFAPTSMNAAITSVYIVIASWTPWIVVSRSSTICEIDTFMTLESSTITNCAADEDQQGEPLAHARDPIRPGPRLWRSAASRAVGSGADGARSSSSPRRSERSALLAAGCGGGDGSSEGRRQPGRATSARRSRPGRSSIGRLRSLAAGTCGLSKCALQSAVDDVKASTRRVRRRAQGPRPAGHAGRSRGAGHGQRARGRPRARRRRRRRRRSRARRPSPGAITAVTNTLTTMSNQLTSTFTQLGQLDAQGEMQAFKTRPASASDPTRCNAARLVLPIAVAVPSRRLRSAAAIAGTGREADRPEPFRFSKKFLTSPCSVFTRQGYS